MPLLNMTPENALNPLWLLATMIYPNDQKRRHGMMSVKLVNGLLNEEIYKDIGKEILSSIINSPEEDKINKDVKLRFKYGQISGDVLSFLHRMHWDGHKEPSLRKAYYLVSEDYKATKTIAGDNIPSSDKILRESFEEYKNVSHFWAAIREMQIILGAQTQEGKSLLNPFASIAVFCLDYKLFLSTLAIAEQLRLFGESFIPSREKSRKSVLDPATTWKVPEAFPLPSIKPGEPPHCDWTAKKLDEYSNAKRDSFRL